MRDRLRAMSAAGVCRLMFWAGKMEEIGELIVNGQEALRLSRRFEPLHDPLSSPRRLRNYSQTLGDQEGGWLKGIADQHVGRALALIHSRIGNPWSVESLAREVGLSRSAFIDRFSTLVGMPPIRYLTISRLQTVKREANPAR